MYLYLRISLPIEVIQDGDWHMYMYITMDKDKSTVSIHGQIFLQYLVAVCKTRVPQMLLS